MAIETLYATSHIAGTFANPDNAVGSDAGTWAGDLNVQTNYTSRWALGNPVSPLTPASTQTIKILARKGTNSGTPTLSINLYENGVLVQEILATTNITSTTGQVLSTTFSSSLLTNRADAEIEVVEVGASGGPSVRNAAQIAYIQWDADTSPAIEINNLTQAQTLDAVVVEAPTFTAGSDIVQGTVSETPTLVIADLAHAHVLDAVVVTIPTYTAGSDIVQGTVSVTLAIASLAQTQTLESPTVTTEVALTVSDLAQAQSLESPVVTSETTLAINNLTQAHTLESVTLSLESALVIAALVQAQTLESPTVTYQHTLAVANLAQTQSLESPTLSAEDTLAISNLTQAQSLESVTVTYESSLTVADLAQTHTLESPTVTVPSGSYTSGSDVVQGSIVADPAPQPGWITSEESGGDVLYQWGAVGTTQSTTLAINNLTQAQTLESPAVAVITYTAGSDIVQGTVATTLVVSDLTQTQTLSNVTITGAIVHTQDLSVDVIVPALRGPATASPTTNTTAEDVSTRELADTATPSLRSPVVSDTEVLWNAEDVATIWSANEPSQNR